MEVKNRRNSIFKNPNLRLGRLLYMGGFVGNSFLI